MGIMATIVSAWVLAGYASAAPAASQPAVSRPASQPARREMIAVVVDPRVELLSIIFRLAGNEEYYRGRVPSYLEDIDRHFGPYRNHKVIALARRLRQSRGVSYDAPMSLAVHLTDAVDLKLRSGPASRPAGLDSRWRAAELREFLALARDFARQADFAGFVRDHQGLYDRTAERMRALMAEHADMAWFESFFGGGAKTRFSVYLGLVNGGSCYGPKVADGERQESYCILGVWEIDADGQPRFPRSVLPTVVHEFCHSFCNPLIEENRDALLDAAQALYAPRAERMRRMAYGNPETLLCESLVRACVVRYRAAHEGPLAAVAEIAEQRRRGFPWTGELVALLTRYEQQRDTYPTLADFMPRIVAFFNDQARRQTAAATAGG